MLLDDNERKAPRGRDMFTKLETAIEFGGNDATPGALFYTYRVIDTTLR